MYHEETDTPANARSTTVTDLGQIKYIFSDKTGTLTQNIMNFKRCSIDGLLFGAPIVKSAPGGAADNGNDNNTMTLNALNVHNGQHDHDPNNDGIPMDAFHPLSTLLYGAGVPTQSQSLPVLTNDGNHNPNKDGLGNGMDPPSTSSGNGNGSEGKTKKKYLTFNAEMFLRVMSICHTVVVETDYADEDGDDDNTNQQRSGVSSWLSSGVKSLVSSKQSNTSNTNTGSNSIVGSPMSAGAANTNNNVNASATNGDHETTTNRNTNVVPLNGDNVIDHNDNKKKNDDGAPHGESYQAESPDEGALVSAASNLYEFQFLGRDSTGIRISCDSPSLLEVSQLASHLKDGSLRPQELATVSASTEWDAFLAEQERNSDNTNTTTNASSVSVSASTPKEETWQVLAVNKFDSTRKRMSVVVRSPPELGSVMMLLCKGADSAMLDPDVCQMNDTTDNNDASLAMESHLGQFATEGLRTLVLAIRILPEAYGESWVAQHAAAASSIKHRDDKLTQVAEDIERDLHVVGITAIEDKLQDGVPEAISKLASAGIKLWVLTGDKRETAIEIGYATKVLTPAMTLFQVSADGHTGDTNNHDAHAKPSQTKKADRIRTIVASEFMRLVKTGALPQYQNEVLKAKAEEHCRFFKDVWDLVSFTWNTFWDWFWFFICFPCRVQRSIFAADDVEDPDGNGNANAESSKKAQTEKEFEVNVVERRLAVRKTAEELIQHYLDHKKANAAAKAAATPSRSSSAGNGKSEEQVVLEELSDSSPTVFDRASAAAGELLRRGNNHNNSTSLRSMSIASHTSSKSSVRLVDEDMLSLASFRMDDQSPSNFSTKKRTLWERTFAVDRDVRHGSLTKHLTPLVERGEPLVSQQQPQQEPQPLAKPVPVIGVTGGVGENTEEVEIQFGDTRRGSAPASIAMDVNMSDTNSNSQPRALIVEGAALAYFMTDPLLQEMLFAVASCCDAIIACRVSPKQKALLVRTVRTFVLPEPLTLAIGDGANDVGMIQEAHVGIGISGLEGQQAVNASDFSIAQFRFLEELLLTHGRWSFTRMARVVLFSFYKNAVLACLLVAYCGQNEFSGTTLFDEWVISMFNFVCTIPILFVGLFDRDVPREYVQRHPQLYAAGPSNEEMSLRKVFRWVFVTMGHTFVIFYIGFPMLNYNSTMTSAWRGLMWNNTRDYPGDGEGDLSTAGLAIYLVLVFTLAFKALYETKSIIYGKFLPCLTYCCDKSTSAKEGVASRLNWTWNAVTWGSIFFFVWAVYLYEYTALGGNPSYTQFIGVASHTFETRGVVWLTVLLVPITATGFDVIFKTVANMYFPTQTQIHAEICVLREQKAAARKKKEQQTKCCSCTLPQFQVSSSGSVIYNEEQ
jgi:magnesium-transporting ATPase (P-type)